ncbi:MAG: hypothetical protein OQK46_00435 [Gammaproteobacteria bacterium]|nr:hypothetical protein [Gammaproteobacteria bacterium]
MQDLYKTPRANLDENEENKTYDFELYKITGIGLATFVGSTLAGGFLIAQNYKRLGNVRMANKTLTYTVLATIVLFLIAYFMPENMNVPNIVFTIVQVAVLVQIAKKLQQKELSNHVAHGGALASNWKAFGISLLVIIVLLAVLIPVIMLTAE